MTFRKIIFQKKLLPTNWRKKTLNSEEISFRNENCERHDIDTLRHPEEQVIPQATEAKMLDLKTEEELSKN